MKKHLLLMEQLPEAYREPYIKTGYRYPYCTLKQSIEYMLVFHNETLNFWTHFIPFWFHIYKISTLELSDPYWYPLLVLLLGQAMCYLCSSLAHLFSAMSINTRHIWFIIDYSAISAVFMGCGISLSYYYGPHHVTRSTAIIITALISLLVLVLSSLSRFHQNKTLQQCIRIASFSLLILFCSYLEYTKHFTTGLGPTLMYHVMTSMSLLATGVTLAARFPERFFPRKFDYFFSSHQLFHITTTVNITLTVFTNEWDAIRFQAVLRKDALPSVSNTLGPFILFLISECFVIYIIWRYLKYHHN